MSSIGAKCIAEPGIDLLPHRWLDDRCVALLAAGIRTPQNALLRHVLTPVSSSVESAPASQGLPPRIARLVALAHKLDGLVRSGAIAGYAELAQLGHASPARVTQIMVLLYVAPAIQEYFLFLPPCDARFLTELGLRKITREPRWDRQRERFERLLKN